MTSDATIPSRMPGIPVREICAEVVEGPDKGAAINARDAAITIGTADNNALQLSDPTVSGYHVELRRAGDRIRLVDLGSTNGTQIGPVVIREGHAMVQVGTIIELGASKVRISEGANYVEEVSSATELGALRGHSEVMQQVMRKARQVASSHVPVLVVGESGTGKELLSRALHDESPRASRPFVTVDCASISGTLFSSELFGHERGAFTGAIQQHTGAFERANGGTIFLDEIGELPPSEQSTLLGVLERRRFTRVGGTREIEVDVRVVAATNRDLRADVNRGEFRLDLYYRLAVVRLEMPPLRERPEDLEPLIRRFAIEEGFEGSLDELFKPEDLERLSRHRFPGNVRELRNLVAAAIATGEAPEVDADLSSALDAKDAHLELTYKEAKATVTRAFEKAFLTRLLERSGGSFRKAAKIAKMNRSYLLELLDRHDMRKSD